MERLALLLLPGCVAWLPGGAAMAEEPVPTVSIASEKLCTDRPPSIFVFRAQTAGMVSPLRFDWDLGNGRHWEEAEVPEQPYEFGRYNVVLAVSDATGRVKKASMALDVEAQGCGGM